MLSLFLSSCILLFLFIVIGVLFFKHFSIKLNVIELIFVGLIFLNTTTSIISIFLPIDWKILLLLILFGCFILLFLKDDFFILWAILYKKRKILFLASPFIAISFLVSLSPQTVYDAGLYHIQAIKWIQEYPTIPGLANLHTRFGYNPNIFSLNALSSLKGIFGYEIYSINFSVIAVLIIYFLNLINFEWKARALSPILIFYFIIFYEILRLYPLLSSPTPDFLATSIVYFVFVRFVDLFINGKSLKFENYIPILVLIIYLLTVKLSVLPLFFLFLIPFTQFKFTLKHLIILTTLTGFIWIPWLIKNVILTGWLVYPFPFIDLLKVDWKIPNDLVIIEQKHILGWARIPGHGHLLVAEMPIQNWFPSWWQNLLISKKVLFIGSLFFPLILISIWIIKRRSVLSFPMPFIISSFMGVIFWFIMAPDFRFGRAFIVLAVITPLLNFRLIRLLYLRKMIYFHLIILGLLLNFSRITYMNNKDFLISLNFQTKFQKTNQPSDLQFKTHNLNDINIFVPLGGDQCFDHPLPCTNKFVDLNAIEMRGINMREGFRSRKNPIND